MAITKKTLFADNLDKYNTFVTDTDPLSKYFKLTELPDTFTGGKNAFLIQGSEYLVADSLIKIELKDAKGDIIYHEPGEGIISASVNGEPIVTEYYEGVSKLVSVYIYPDTAFGPCTLTILGELSSYDNNGINTPIPANWEGSYNVKWQKEINVVPSLANTTKIRFYKRPTASITEILSPIYKIENDLKVASSVTQSFANIKLSNLETFAGDVKRVKVFRTSIGDISDYDMIQDILVESKELLTSFGLSDSVVGNTGIFISEVLKNQWNSGSLNATLNSTRVEAGVRLTGSGNFTYTQSLDLKSTNTYELSLDAFYSASTDSNLEIYLSQVTTSIVNGVPTPTTISSSIGTLIGTFPTKNLLDTTIPFKIDKDYPTASLYFSQSQGEWHIGNVSLKLSEDTAFSPDEIGFITTMPTVLGNETFNFKFEFYDVNNNYVPVEVTQSALFNGGNTNIGGTILLISSSTSSSLADLNRVSASISGTMTVYSSSASGTIGSVSSSVSGTIGAVSSSVSGTIGAVSSSVSGTITTLSGSVSGSIYDLSSSVSTSVRNAKADAFARVQQLANGGVSGTFIDNNLIYSPVIGGQLGYISELFKVGTTPSIYLDARQNPRKIFIGGAVNPSDTVYNEYSGAFNNTNTNVYLDSTGKFSLGNKLSWNGNSLTVIGSIDITGGGAQTQIANAALSGSNAQTTANAASDAATAASSSAAIAKSTADAANDKIFTDAAGKIVKAAAPSGKGLFLSSTHLGYYNTTDFPSSPWRTYMNSSGDFFLNGTGTNGLTWNAGASTLTIDGNITARSGRFYGNITSEANISGGTITGGSISGGTIVIGEKFSVDSLGNISATDANLTGTVNANTGRFGSGANFWSIGASTVENSITATTNGRLVLNAARPAMEIYDGNNELRVDISAATSFSSTEPPTISISGDVTSQTSRYTGNKAYGGSGASFYDSTQYFHNQSVTFSGASAVGKVATIKIPVTGNPGAQYVEGESVVSNIIGITFGARITKGDGTVVATVTGTRSKSTGTNGTAQLDGYAGTTLTTGLTLENTTYTITPFISNINMQAWASNTTFGKINQLVATLYTPDFGTVQVTIPVGKTEIVAGGMQIIRDSENYVRIDRNPGTVAILAVTGEGTFTGDVTANTSDKRLKNNIRVIDNPLEKLSKINGVYFNWNDIAKKLANKKDNEEVGFLAQEVQSVLPHIIKPAPFDIDENNNSKSGENYLTIQYEKIVPLLVEAIKELKREVDELKNK
jgi:hypothetical protein